jgi:hypothetical protein
MPACNFRLGQKVVCIDAGKLDPQASDDWDGDAPREGEVYTIRAMAPACATFKGEQMISLYFEEIRRGAWWGCELGYWHVRFRGLEQQKRQTDISVFKKLLDECKEPV